MNKFWQGRFSVLLCGICLCPEPSVASVTRSAGVEISTRIVENADLEPAENGQSDTVLSVEPGAAIILDGEVTDVAVAGSVAFRAASRDSVEEVSPQLSVESNSVFHREQLGFAASATLGRRSFSRTPLGEDDVDGDSEVDTFDFQLGPSVNLSFDNRSILQADYVYSRGVSLDSEVEGGYTQTFSTTYLAPLGRSGVILGSQVGGQNTKLDNDNDAGLGQASLIAAWLQPGSLLLASSIGRDWERLGGESGYTQTDSWAVGARYTPGQRLSFKAGYAQRSFGRSPFLGLGYSARRWGLEAEWSRQYAGTTDARSLTELGESSLGQVESSTEDTDLVPGELVNNIAVVQLDTTIREAVSINYTLRGRVSELQLRAALQIDSDRDSIQEEKSRLFEITVLRNIGRFIQVGITGQLRALDRRESLDETLQANGKADSQALELTLRYRR